MATCGDSFRNVDQFGPPIKLTYEKKPTYNTTCGSIFTIIMLAALAYYTLSGLVAVWNNEITSMPTYDLWFDVSTDYGMPLN